ncbi:hypothetical protein AB0383_20460 [Amycolatopsis sp. NPDC051373]|uniref:hypothetical protein n=1 Tax=Amycolatopsis sp. NPDC051373 TaxID=3155801 RepID=UPI003450877D
MTNLPCQCASRIGVCAGPNAATPDRCPDGCLTDEASARVTAEFDADFPLGVACSITDPDCEACQ